MSIYLDFKSLFKNFKIGPFFEKIMIQTNALFIYLTFPFCFPMCFTLCFLFPFPFPSVASLPLPRKDEKSQIVKSLKILAIVAKTLNKKVACTGRRVVTRPSTKSKQKSLKKRQKLRKT